MSSDELLAAYGWPEGGFADLETEPDAQPGRVVRVDRAMLTAVTASGMQRLPVRGLDVTTGDWVLVSTQEPSAVAGVLPRWSALHRHDPGRAAVTQTLAANIDVGFVVDGLDRGPNVARIDRLLTLVWSAGATPVVVLTKSDLVDEPERAVARVGGSTVGVEVVPASSLSGQGIDRLRALVPPGRTAVLIGESGSGKSSLVNSLVGSSVQVTGSVRGGDRKGRHTTRARELVPIPGGGVLLDTPGIREAGLVGDQDDGIDRTFADILELARGCRFADCRHAAEPGCAVAAAVTEGRLDSSRLASFHALAAEVASAARRADVRADRAASRAWGRQHKQLKEHLRHTRGDR